MTSSNQQKTQKGRGTAVMNELFATGAIPVTPESYILQFISFVRIAGASEKYKTIPQLIAFLKEIGFQPSICTVEDVANLIAVLESETDAELDVICGVILHLIDRAPTDARRRRTTINFLLGFITSDNRKTFVDRVTSSHQVPLFAGGIFPPIHDTDLGDDDWAMLLRGLVTITCQTDPFKTLDTARTEWTRVVQRGCISDYLYREVAAWTKLVTVCASLNFEAPPENQRVDRLLANLDGETKTVIGQVLRGQVKRAELLTFAEAVETLNDIQTKLDITFAWEKPRRSEAQPGMQFPPLAPGSSHPVPHRVGGSGANAYRKPYDKPPTIAEKPAYENHPKPDAAHNYNLRSKKGIPTFPVTVTEKAAPAPNPAQGASQEAQPQPETSPKQLDDGAKPLQSFAISIPSPTDANGLIGPSYYAPATAGPNSTPINVGFDSFSCITLIRQGLCLEASIVPGKQRSLSGVGGSASISGDTGTTEIRMATGGAFLLSGFISNTLPRGIDVLVGNPQLKNMGAVIGYRDDGVTVNIARLDLSIPLAPIVNDTVSHAVNIDTLPELTLQLQGQLSDIPYQCRHDYQVPPHLQAAARAQIDEEIATGNMKYVLYQPQMWISPLFIKAKGRTDPATGMPLVRLLADLRQPNANLKHPHYWSLGAPNLPVFPDFVIPSADMHFTCLDIKNAYHTCSVSPGSRHLLVVRYGDRLLQYQTAPQGLSTSALFWPRHLEFGFNRLLRPGWNEWCRVFVDDILIYGATENECAARTAEVIDCLKGMNKAISPKSTVTPQREISCVGLQFSGDGIRFSDEGMEKLRKCMDIRPRSCREMRRLIGGILYAQIAFDCTDSPSTFGSLMGPLHRATTVKPFRYTEEIAAAITELRRRIKNPTTGYCNPGAMTKGTLVITTDASDTGIGACLFLSDASADTILQSPREALEHARLQALRDITIDNTQWNLALLENKSRTNAAIISTRQNRSRPGTIKLNVDDDVMYDGRVWRIENLVYGPSKTIPTTAILRDMDDVVRVRYDQIRIAPRQRGVVPAPYEVPTIEGQFVFYRNPGDSEVYGGVVTTVTTTDMYVHLYSPNRDQSIYHPNWWTRSEVDGWVITRNKNEPRPSLAPRPVINTVKPHEVLAAGNISETGRLSHELRTQLHAHGVFASRS